MEHEPSIEKQIIAEIGPGPNPIYRLFRNSIFEKIGIGSVYVAIDCRPDELKNFSSGLTQNGCAAVVGDLKRLPLKSDSVHQVWLMNVFGGFENRPKILPSGGLEHIVGFGGVFQELARVLKRKGKIFIGEIYRPRGNISWLTDEDYSGIGLEKKVYKGDEEVRSFWGTMGGREAMIDGLQQEHDHLPFFLELTKM